MASAVDVLHQKDIAIATLCDLVELSELLAVDVEDSAAAEPSLHLLQTASHLYNYCIEQSQLESIDPAGM